MYTSFSDVILVARDEPGGSGIQTTSYSVDGEPPAYTAPFPLELVSQHTICWRSTDKAGNVEPETKALTVERNVAAVLTTAAPPGTAGWFTSPPQVTSTVTSTLTSTGDGFLARVDDGTEWLCRPTCEVDRNLLGDGEHRIVAKPFRDYFTPAVELQRLFGETQALDVKVDTQAPVADLVLSPFADRGNGGWLLERPWAFAEGRDAESGSRRLSTRSRTRRMPATAKAARSSSRPARPTSACGPPMWRGGADLVEHYVYGFPPLTPDRIEREEVLIEPSDAACGPRPAGAGVCVSIDDGPWTGVGSVTLGDGVHAVRAFAVDEGGRRSAVASTTVRVDTTAPTVSVGTVHPAAGDPWHRAATIVVTAFDGVDASGVGQASYRVDGGAVQTYAGPFALGDGRHVVEAWAVDRSGSDHGGGGHVSQVVWVDSTAPTARPTNGATTLGPGGTVPLGFATADAAGGTIRVRAVVLDATGAAVRRLDGAVTAAPGQEVAGSMQWRGENDAGQAVPPGTYHYRVAATDAAANVAMSGESAQIAKLG